MPPPQHHLALCILAAGSILGAAPLAQAEPLAAGPALVKAYPDFLDRVDGNELVWRDGTRMPIDDGSPAKPLDAMLDHPDLKDMFSMPYPAGEKGTASLQFRSGPRALRAAVSAHVRRLSRSRLHE
jgi:hypothetical protein